MARGANCVQDISDPKRIGYVPRTDEFLQLQLLAPGHFAYVRQAVKLLISTGIVKAVPDDRETRYPRYVLAVGFQDVSLDVETE